MPALVKDDQIEYTFAVNKIIKSHGGTHLALREIVKEGTMFPQLIAAVGERNVTAMVIVMIKNYCLKFNVNKNMNELQMLTLAEQLIDIATSSLDNKMPLEELSIFFHNAALGHYKTKANPNGFPFDRIDAGVVIEFFDKYLEDQRTPVIHELLDEKHNAWKKDATIIPRSGKPMSFEEALKANQPVDMKPKNNVIIPGINSPLKENNNGK